MEAWRPKHVEDYDIKLVTLLWCIMIHSQQNIKKQPIESSGSFCCSFTRCISLLQRFDQLRVQPSLLGGFLPLIKLVAIKLATHIPQVPKLTMQPPSIYSRRVQGQFLLLPSTSVINEPILRCYIIPSSQLHHKSKYIDLPMLESCL
jgi:hypothetical protein